MIPPESEYRYSRFRQNRAGDEADYLAKLSEVITLRKEGIPTVLSPEITENEEADQ